MSMALDPGTLHTGVVIVKGTFDSIEEILEIRKIEKKSKDGKAPVRIAHIVNEVREMLDQWQVTEMWTELFIPYGRRRGAMHNMNLVGALLYMPATRSIEGLHSYGLHAGEWKRWIKAQYPDLEMHQAVRNLCALHDVTLTDEAEAGISDPHCCDALGILLFIKFGVAEDAEHETGHVQE